MAAKFTQFLDFPKEIQLLIWEAAVRPPGDRHVHRFSIDVALRHENEKRLRLQRTEDLSNGSSRLISCHILTVPLDDVEGNINDSIYLSDSGLWTACKDSRGAMERRFKRNEWWSHIESPYHPKRTAMPGQCLGQEDASHTASYTDDNGVVRHITIGYERDLIHLDPRSLYGLTNIRRFHSSDNIVLPHHGNDLGAKPSFFGANIALDYDRSILDGLRSRKVHCQEDALEFRSVFFASMWSLLLEAQRTIWLIDYGLVPGLNAAVDTTRMREVFRSGDCIYTEVKREDIGVLWHISEYDKAYDDENHTAFDVVRILEERRWAQAPPLLRVLACQPAPGRIVKPQKPWALRCHGHPSCEVCNAEKSTIDREYESGLYGHDW